jgi:hypothetical protein
MRSWNGYLEQRARTLSISEWQLVRTGQLLNYTESGALQIVLPLPHPTYTGRAVTIQLRGDQLSAVRVDVNPEDVNMLTELLDILTLSTANAAPDGWGYINLENVADPCDEDVPTAQGTMAYSKFTSGPIVQLRAERCSG